MVFQTLQIWEIWKTLENQVLEGSQNSSPNEVGARATIPNHMKHKGKSNDLQTCLISQIGKSLKNHPNQNFAGSRSRHLWFIAVPRALFGFYIWNRWVSLISDHALCIFPALGVLADAFFSLLVALGVHPWRRFRRGAGRSHFSTDPYSSSCSTLGFFLYALGVLFTLNVFLCTLSVLAALGFLADMIIIHTCTMSKQHACIMIIVHACTMNRSMHVLWS